jgi:hypothetical protein
LPGSGWGPAPTGPPVIRLVIYRASGERIRAQATAVRADHLAATANANNKKPAPPAGSPQAARVGCSPFTPFRLRCQGAGGGSPWRPGSASPDAPPATAKCTRRRPAFPAAAGVHLQLGHDPLQLPPAGRQHPAKPPGAPRLSPAPRPAAGKPCMGLFDRTFCANPPPIPNERPVGRQRVGPPPADRRLALATCLRLSGTTEWRESAGKGG